MAELERVREGKRSRIAPPAGSGKGGLRVCVLGNFSGRNAGDMAILGCLMRDLAAEYPGASFVVPTLNPRFVAESFPHLSIQPVSLQPWALSLKIFGLPIFRAVLSSEMVLVTDNILFDRKLFNPLFNYLSTLSLVLPLARRRGIPVILYNMSLGPISTAAGKYCFGRVIRNTDLIILRDSQSLELLERLGMPSGPVEMGADCALNADPCPPERLQAIAAREGLFRNPRGTVGFNVNAYLDAYLNPPGGGSDPQQFQDVIAQSVDRVIEATGLEALFVVTQVMDLPITRQVLSRIRHRDAVRLVSNQDYTYEELAGILGGLELLVGMRTHALILASAMGTPVVGILSYPKTAGYLASIEQERWCIPFHQLSVPTLTSLVLEACERRAEMRAALAPAIEREKRKARGSARRLAPFVASRREGTGSAEPAREAIHEP